MIENIEEKVLSENLLKKVTKISFKEWSNLEKSLEKNKDLDLSFRKEIKKNILQSIPSKIYQNMIFSPQFKKSPFLRKFILKAVSERTDISSKSFISFEIFSIIFCEES